MIQEKNSEALEKRLFWREEDDILFLSMIMTVCEGLKFNPNPTQIWRRDVCNQKATNRIGYNFLYACASPARAFGRTNIGEFAFHARTFDMEH